MRRSIFIILSLFILVSAVASDASRQRRSRTTPKRTAVAKSKPKAKKPAAPKVNVDSIEAAQLMQRRADSLNTVTAKALEGDVSALNQLASWYYTGHLVDQDYAKAVELWREASDKSDVRATASLGLCYRLGHGVPTDTIEAARLYGKSIREGNGTLFKQCIDSASVDVFSAILIGNCYQLGDGVKKDVSRAAEFYGMAAALGSVHAMREAGLCYIQCGDTINAEQYFILGADNSDPVSEYWAGKILLDEGSTGRAVGYLSRAAESKVAEAQSVLGSLYAAGRGVDRDPVKAAELFRLSAEQNCPEGMWSYAEALSEGAGVKADFSKALSLMADAVAAGYDIGIEPLQNELLTANSLPFDTYVRAMQSLLVDNDIASVTNLAKQLDKANVAEGKLLQALALASKANPKANAKKAAKILSGLSAFSPEAKYYLTQINASGVPSAIDVAKAVADYRNSDNIISLLSNLKDNQ